MSVEDSIDFKNPTDFERISAAIEFISEHYKEQPSLDEVAKTVNLSPFHFQRMFTEWVGTSPKKFLRYISLEHAKKILKGNPVSLAETSHNLGLSGPSRLHDLFVGIEGMTPAEYRNAGQGLTINYTFGTTPFGNVIVASTDKGICYMAFHDDEHVAFSTLVAKFPNATYYNRLDQHQQAALSIFSLDWSQLNQVKLHLKGSEFQLKVWQALLQIPFGGLSTYGTVAASIGKPSASRAVGTAIGSNPVAFLIPCHRVIQSSGIFGGYMWGKARKAAMIGWEGIKRPHDDSCGLP